jgi:hypothetical protein
VDVKKFLGDDVFTIKNDLISIALEFLRLQHGLDEIASLSMRITNKVDIGISKRNRSGTVVERVSI